MTVEWAVPMTFMEVYGMTMFFAMTVIRIFAMTVGCFIAMTEMDSSKLAHRSTTFAPYFLTRNFSFSIATG